MNAKTTETKDDTVKKAAGAGDEKRLGWNDSRLLAGAVVVLIALSVYNTIALHLVRSTESGDTVSMIEDDGIPSADGVESQSDTANETDETPTPTVDGPDAGEPATSNGTATTTRPDPAVARNDAELERLFLRAEQSLSERERVLNYIFYANSFREVHRDRLAEEARAKAASGTPDGTLVRDLLKAGDRLRDEGDFAAAREAYYLRLCRSSRLGAGQPATTYFRIADLYFREAMSTPFEEGGGL